MAPAAGPDATLTDLRRRLHAAAELSGQEEKTAALLERELTACRPDQVVTGLGGHGLAAVFAGRDPGPTVLLRCDTDALPLPDRTDLPHASRTPHVSHKCGHDGHMAMLVGLAQRLASAPPARGRAVLLFQPAEEIGAGARRVLDDPLFAALRPDRVLAVHNLPGYELGTVVVRKGAFAAASRGLTIDLAGASSHAAEPEQGRSPAQAAAALVQAISALPQLEASLSQGAKATVVGLQVGGPAFGTSPGTGTVMVTLRSFSDEVMARLSDRCTRLAENIATAHDLQCSLSWSEDFPATVNDPDSVALVADAARSAGLLVVERQEPFAWSEDFGHFTAAHPGALVGLGSGRDQPALHHPEYDFPDPLLPVGVEFWHAALDRLLQQDV
jgi:amidohydrolase